MIIVIFIIEYFFFLLIITEFINFRYIGKIDSNIHFLFTNKFCFGKK